MTVEWDCQCMCFSCRAPDAHCGGHNCRYIDDNPDTCEWCYAPLDDCLSDACDDRVEWHVREFA